MKHLSTDLKHNEEGRIQWRRDKVQELTSKGHSQREIASLLKIGIATVNRDISFLRQQAKDNIKKYIDEEIATRVREMSCWLEQHIKGGMEHVTGKRQQNGKDKGVDFGERML